MRKIFETRSLKGALIVAALATAGPASADGFLKGENWWVGGRVKQGFSLAYDNPDDQGARLGPSNYLAELKGNWNPDPDLTFTGDLWIRGDLYPRIGGHIRQRGIQSVFDPQFNGFPFGLNEKGLGTLPRPFGTNGRENEAFTDLNEDVVRELALKFRGPDNAFAMKIGKFQRGWGQSDGLRLLDVLNAQDLRSRAILSDADETRIPAWSVALDLNFREMGVSGPFEAIGLSRPTLELIYIPENHHDNFVINNPTPLGPPASGGIFGFPFPRLFDPVSGLNMPLLGAQLNERNSKKWSFEEGTFGARLKFQTLGGEGTINGFLGRQELPLVKLTGGFLTIGNPFGFSGGGSATVPLNLATTVGAFHLGYLPFLRSLANGTATPGTFPLIPFGCNDILVAAPNCALTAAFQLDYKQPKRLIGFSFTREMTELQLGPKNVSPVLRIESTFEFQKPFNKRLVNTPFGTSELGSPALIIDPSEAITKRNQWSVLVGADYFFWLPDARRSIFTSLQFFNIHTPSADQLLAQAPYSFWKLPENQQYTTFLWSADVMHDVVGIEGLTIVDFNSHGTIHRQRVDYRGFGDAYRPRLEWIHSNGPAEKGLPGLLDHSDILELSFTYQF